MTDPLRFVAHYEADECGDSYELWNCKVPYIHLPCDDCGEKHYYHFKYLEHRIMEWDAIEWGLTDESS